ncbi:MAG TPA: septum formation family protein [Propionicimonas sp.]|jgi:Septum formation|nr:septum formation family protein [Propionicimonas sp.]
MVLSRRWVALALLVTVAAAGCTTTGPRTPSGTPTAVATIGAFDVRVGDCTGELPSGGISSVTLIPCGQEHYWEAFHSAKLTEETYPGQTAINEEGTKLCKAAFTEFVGVAPTKSTLKFTFFYPTQDTWQNTGDREVLCILGSPKGGLTGSAKDTKK